MTKMGNVQHRVLDSPMLPSPPFYLDMVDINTAYKNVRSGQIIQIALKEDVRPGSVRSSKKLLIAPYSQVVVVEPQFCCCGWYSQDENYALGCPGCGDNEMDAHGSTICPNCVDSWAIDWFVRYEPKMIHGTDTAYLTYGCRCPLCRGRHSKDGKARGYRRFGSDR